MLRALLRRSTLATVVVLAGFAVNCRPADAQGTTRFSYNGKTFDFVATDTSGNLFHLTFPGNPGDFLRQNPDGTYSIHAESNSAQIEVTPAGFPFPVLAGVTSFHYTASVDVSGYTSQGDPIWMSDGEFVDLSGSGELTNIFDGSPWSLVTHVLQRHQVFTKYEVDLTPL
jgi:hypothetical protein